MPSTTLKARCNVLSLTSAARAIRDMRQGSPKASGPKDFSALDVRAVLNTFSTLRSGSVDWTDPFIGARLRNAIGPGEELVLRAEFGGFGVGSDFSWQVLATYNWQICKFAGHVLDGYVGYRALSVDYSQGSGGNRYNFDVLFRGPVIGSTLHF